MSYVRRREPASQLAAAGVYGCHTPSEHGGDRPALVLDGQRNRTSTSWPRAEPGAGRHRPRTGADPHCQAGRHGPPTDDNNSFYYGWVHKRNPCTFAGFEAQGRTLLVTDDGRQTSSLGLSIKETADVARSLGMVQAMNLDGCGSTMVSGGAVVNFPSDGTERAVGDAVGICREVLVGSRTSTREPFLQGLRSG